MNQTPLSCTPDLAHKTLILVKEKFFQALIFVSPCGIGRMIFMLIHITVITPQRRQRSNTRIQ